MDLRAVLIEIHGALAAESIAHALIGGLALAAHGSPRGNVGLELLVDGARAEDARRILLSRHYKCIHAGENIASFGSEEPTRGRVDLIFAHGAYGLATFQRAVAYDVLGACIPIADAADLIALEVQSSSDNPARVRRNLVDIQCLLETADVALERVRELEPFLADGLSEARRRDFAASDRACREWERAHPISIEGVLAWIDQLRAAFGEPPVDRTPWRGDDFRI